MVDPGCYAVNQILERRPKSYYYLLVASARKLDKTAAGSVAPKPSIPFVKLAAIEFNLYPSALVHEGISPAGLPEHTQSQQPSGAKLLKPKVPRQSEVHIKH